MQCPFPCCCSQSCGKCKQFQGGATTLTKQLTFLQQGEPFLSDWGWGHQGIFLVRMCEATLSPWRMVERAGASSSILWQVLRR
jgi:hypothetical protein